MDRPPDHSGNAASPLSAACLNPGHNRRHVDRRNPRCPARNRGGFGLGDEVLDGIGIMWYNLLHTDTLRGKMSKGKQRAGLYITPALRKRISAMAKSERRSFNQMVTILIEQGFRLDELKRHRYAKCVVCDEDIIDHVCDVARN